LPEHDEPGKTIEKCRLCQLRQLAAKTQAQLKSRAGRGVLHLALGLAVPCIEAWLCCGIDAHVTEAAWLVGQQSRKPPYDPKRLKQAV
jgi:hypothetical protein